MRSLALLSEVIAEERRQQGQHFDALDAKSGVVLGFAGVLIALAPNVGTWWRVGALSQLAVSALLATASFWPRGLPALDAGQLRRYLAAETEFTQLTLYDTQVVMIGEARAASSRKARLLKTAMLLLAGGGLTLAVALIVGGPHA